MSGASAVKVPYSMNQQIQKSVAPDTVVINQQYFRETHGAAFVKGSPHLKHPSVGKLCSEIATEVFRRLPTQNGDPKVLDMGAGDGMLTLPYLNLGARVVAADASDELLNDLKHKAGQFHNSLTVMAGDIFASLEQLERKAVKFDIICASSFLHHIPDYLDLFRRALPLLAPHGVFFSVQDPLRYDTLSRSTYFFDRLSYFGWRSMQGDYVRGIKTRCRRLFKIYRDDLAADTAEYHVVRNGVDHLAICKLFQAAGMQCEIRPYWSTQSTFFQKLGERMKLNNTFAVIARRPQ